MKSTVRIETSNSQPMTDMYRHFAESPGTEGARPACSGCTAESSGLFIIDKPEGMTSFDVVARIKRWLHLKKVGHCGTLDPFATGVLLICVNQATRIVDQLSEQDKTYRFTIRFGVETDTLDRTGRVVHTCEAPSCTEEKLLSALDRFRGSYRQEVPRYSAVKVQGRRLYALSRSGIDVETLPTREVHIHSLSLLNMIWPEASFEARCSKGTYIRQLAADIGHFLGCGGHVSDLRRLTSGHFRIEQAVSIEGLDEAVSKGAWREKLITMSEALTHLPSVVLEDTNAVKRLIEGQLDPAWEAEYRTHFPAVNEPVRILTPRDELVALWWPHPAPEQKRRLRVLALQPEA